MINEARYDRQKDVVPKDVLDSTIVTIIGCGAIGRQVALQCTAIGCPRIKLIDFDKVEIENLAPQGFMECDLSRLKIDAVADLCLKINSEISISTFEDKFSPDMFAVGVIFCCVDSIRTRREIFESVGHKATLFLDGRMSSEYMRVLSCFDENSRKYYVEQSLFPESEAFRGSCTAKSTIFCASIAAGLMISNFAKWLREIEIEKDLRLNLLSNELIIGGIDNA